jgi:3-oxosteroid 1-dehydrogenase
MDEYYWYPTAIDPAGRPGTAGARAGGMLVEPERHMPHSIIVDSSGARYMNEASDYMRIGRAMYERHRTVDAIPSWLIIDRRHRLRYPFGLSGPGPTPRAWFKSGFMFKARRLEELANACEIDRAGLIRTVGHFNAMAAAGVDEDFGRGASAYDRRYGDPAAPNPCLGPISAPPYYAVRVFPGDVGCAGGLLTDDRARVLRAGNRPGTPIDGLYACGTTAASVMGRVYPGGGVSIGQSMAFGFLAAEDIIGRRPLWSSTGVSLVGTRWVSGGRRRRRRGASR